MNRKDFLQMSALTAGGFVLPKSLLFGRAIDPLEALNERMDVSIKKQLADVALNAAKAKAPLMPMCGLAAT